MINGFIIEIKNTGTELQQLSLFKQETLPPGITVITPNTDYDYNALLQMAQSQGFYGNGINADQILKVIIHDGLNSETVETKFLTGKEIVIDGFSKYITISVPPQSEIIFQLMPAV